MKSNSANSESATNDSCRGTILYKNRAKQLHEFKGLRYKNITPTDIDGCFEIADKIFVFFELKSVGAPFLDGQRIAIERICDNIQKPTIAIVATHDTLPHDIVKAAECFVLKAYYKGKWIESTKQCTLKSAIDWFLEKNGFKEWVKETTNG